MSSLNNEGSNNLSFGDHLETLRKHLIRVIIFISFTTILAFLAKSFIFNKIILFPISSDFILNQLMCKLSILLGSESLCYDTTQNTLINIQISGQFMLHIYVSLTFGLIIGCPYILYEIWKFIKPALTKSEIKSARGIIISTSVLFLIGALFGYFIITPLAYIFFSNYSLSETIVNQFIVQSYISVLLKSSLACAISFEMPVIIFFLTKMGMITPNGLKKHRKIVIIILFVFSAILTPADPVTMILVAIPLIFLYEISFLISKRVAK